MKSGEERIPGRSVDLSVPVGSGETFAFTPGQPGVYTVHMTRSYTSGGSTVSSTGSVTVIFYDADHPVNGCSEIAVLRQLMTDHKQVDIDEKPKYVVEIWPNPVLDSLNIEISNEKDHKMEILLLSSNGQFLIQTDILDLQPGLNQIKLPVSKYKDGVYILRIKNGHRSIVKKVIKSVF